MTQEDIRTLSDMSTSPECVFRTHPGLLQEMFAGLRSTPSQSPCPPPASGRPDALDFGSVASTTISGAVARHAEIMPAASSSDVITITRGEWEDVMARLRAIEEWLRVAPRVRRY